MEITMEKLIMAAQNLNEILQLNPPMGTTFETSVKGNAKVMAEKKFMKNLQGEIIQLTEYRSEFGEFDLRRGDLPLLLPETVEMIFELSPKAKERLTLSVASVGEEIKPKAEKSKENGHKGKGRLECAISAILFYGVKEKISDNIETVIKRIDSAFGGSANERESKWAINTALRVLNQILAEGYKIEKGS